MPPVAGRLVGRRVALLLLLLEFPLPLLELLPLFRAVAATALEVLSFLLELLRHGGARSLEPKWLQN